jgi:sugar phosphate permease
MIDFSNSIIKPHPHHMYPLPLEHSWERHRWQVYVCVYVMYYLRRGQDPALHNKMKSEPGGMCCEFNETSHDYVPVKC